MKHRIAALVIALTLGATAAAAAPAAAGSGTPSPKAWATGVCTSVETWLTSVEDTITSFDGSGSLRESISDAAGGIGDATRELVHDLEDLGAPPVKGIKQARRLLTKLGDRLERGMQDAREVIADAGDGPLDLASTVADLGLVLGRAVDQVTTTAETLQRLDLEGKLRTALEQSSACTSLRELI